MSETFLVCMIQALHAGYAMGRGERYLKSNMLLPLTEAAIKCIEHGTIKSSDMLSVYSGCVLLNCEKMTMKRLSEIMMKTVFVILYLTHLSDIVFQIGKLRNIPYFRR